MSEVGEDICLFFLQIHSVAYIHSEVTRKTLKERANKLFDKGQGT